MSRLSGPERAALVMAAALALMILATALTAALS